MAAPSNPNAPASDNPKNDPQMLSVVVPNNLDFLNSRAGLVPCSPDELNAEAYSG